eukprot:COSAG01_NODE_16034_length_1277_cov_1.547154_1_plen_46_part_10
MAPAQSGAAADRAVGERLGPSAARRAVLGARTQALQVLVPVRLGVQ